MNNKYIIRVGHPLLRPGLTITTEASERYLVDVVRTLMGAIREINEEVGGVQVIHGSVTVKDAADFRSRVGLGRPIPQDHERPGDPE